MADMLVLNASCVLASIPLQLLQQYLLSHSYCTLCRRRPDSPVASRSQTTVSLRRLLCSLGSQKIQRGVGRRSPADEPSSRRNTDVWTLDSLEMPHLCGFLTDECEYCHSIQRIQLLLIELHKALCQDFEQCNEHRFHSMKLSIESTL